jgi:hypothetical protein
MKKLFSILKLAVLVFAFTLNSCQQKPAGNSGETSVTTPIDSPETIPSDTVGTPTTGWMIGIVVKDAAMRPLADATVTLPCASMTMTTNSSGSATFNGEGNCPCATTDAAIVTKKGKCTDVQVPLTNGCGYTYNTTCQ